LGSPNGVKINGLIVKMVRCQAICKNNKRCLKNTLNDFCNIHEIIIEEPIKKQTSFIYFFFKNFVLFLSMFWVIVYLSISISIHYCIALSLCI